MTAVIIGKIVKKKVLTKSMLSLFAAVVLSCSLMEPTKVSDPYGVDKDVLALFHFKSLENDKVYDELGKWTGNMQNVTLSEGLFGNALKITEQSNASLDTIIPNHLREGTIEMYFSFSSTFDTSKNYCIFGNDGSRVLIIYTKGKFAFLKGHNNIHRFIVGPASILPDKWYHIAATWGSNGINLYLDGELIAHNDDVSDYQTALELYPMSMFQLKIGRKDTGCCMDGINISESLKFNGMVDAIRISKIQRY
jgi:hypothetical protein